MLNFTDKKQFDEKHYVTEESLNYYYETVFPYDSDACMLYNDVYDLCGKIVHDFIKTGQLDFYISAKGEHFTNDLRDQIERDIGVTIFSVLKDMKATDTREWDPSLEDIRPTKTYQLDERYREDVHKIVDIIIDALPEETKQNTELRDMIEHKLIEAIGNEIGNKQELLETEIIAQAKEEIREKTAEEILTKLFDGNKENAVQAKSDIDTIVSLVITSCTHEVAHQTFCLQNGHEPIMSDDKMRALSYIAENQETMAPLMAQRIAKQISNEVYTAYNCLYNEIYLHRRDLKPMDPQIKGEPINKMIDSLAEKVGSLTTVPAASMQREGKLEYYREEGYTIEPEDECQWETFEYIANNSSASVANIRTAIKNTITEIMDDVQKLVAEKSVGDDVLDNDNVQTRTSGLLRKFIDNKSMPTGRDANEHDISDDDPR